MPPVPKPTKKPEWATVIGVYGGKTNAYEPAAGLKPEGDQYALPPTRNHHNWLWHYTGEWTDYLEAMTGASQRAATFTIASETADDKWKQAADYTVGVGADASLVIEAAIAALPATGGRILLSDGLFNLQTQLDFTGLAGYVILQGQGPATLLAYDGFAGTGTMALVDTCEFVQFQDLAFWPGMGAQPWINGVRCIDSKVMFHAVKLGRFWSDDTGTLAVPKGTAIWGSGSELLVSDCDIRLDVTAVPKSEYGVAVTGASRLVIHGTRIWAAGAAGVAQSFRAGIAADGSVVLASNNFIERSYDGVLLSGAACANSQVVGNEILDVAEYGVFFEGAVLVGAHNNTIRNPVSYGIYADAASAKVAADGNSIFNSTFDGIVLAGGYSKACDNLIGSCRNGLVVSGSNNRASGNIIDTLGNDGILLSGSYNQVTDNRVDGSVVGIEITGEYNHVRDNQVENSATAHIIIRQAGANNSVCDNQALPGGTMPATAGLYHEHNTARNNAVYGNFLRGSAALVDMWIQGAYANVLVLPAIVGVDATTANIVSTSSQAP